MIVSLSLVCLFVCFENLGLSDNGKRRKKGITLNAIWSFVEFLLYFRFFCVQITFITI